MTSGPLMSRADIEHAFRVLGERLVGRGVTADIYVIVGAAMALAYDSRRATRDIDAIFEPHGIVVEEAAAVGRQLGLPQWWLNELASVYAAADRDPGAPRVFDHPGLRVSAASAQHMLAMKILAGRQRDADDIRWLTSHLGITAVEAALAICAAVFPDEAVPDRARLLLEDLLGAH